MDGSRTPHTPSAEEVYELHRRRIARQDLAPFQEALARILAADVSKETLDNWASKRPDQWVVAMATLAKVVGYAERREVDVAVSINVSAMSDSQLQEAIAGKMKQLGLDARKVIDVVPDVVTTGDDRETSQGSHSHLHSQSQD